MSGVEVAAGLSVLSGLLQLSVDVAKASQAVQQAQIEGRKLTEDEMNSIFDLMNSASQAAQAALRERAKQ